jgi:hypothetical protein
MISKEQLIETIVKGRYECYVRKSPDYNPYRKGEIYDWEFSMETEGLVFTDAYRGFNPYSGVEYIYEKGCSIPAWSCDYVGYVRHNTGVSAEEVYKFLKEARGNQLMNCGHNLFSNHRYENGMFRYETVFQGDADSMLQIEDFYCNSILVAQQITAGRMREC